MFTAGACEFLALGLGLRGSGLWGLGDELRFRV